MTGRPAKKSELETFLERFCHVKHTEEERITKYWTPLMSTQMDEIVACCWFEFWESKFIWSIKKKISSKACETDSKQLQALLTSFLSKCIFLYWFGTGLPESDPAAAATPKRRPSDKTASSLSTKLDLGWLHSEFRLQSSGVVFANWTKGHCSVLTW